MKRQKATQQLGFQLLEGKNIKHFGGALLGKSNPKEKRPISIKKSMHLVMRSTRAKCALSFLRKDKQVQAIIHVQAQAFGVKIYRLANAGNHIHLIIRPRSRQAFHGFVRAISGLLARLILGVEKGKAKGLRFWDRRPFTRIIEWGREFKSVSAYLLQNTIEAWGFIPHQPRNHSKLYSKQIRSTA